MTAGYDSNYRRYDRIYHAFLEDGVPLAGLLEGTKQIFHNSAPESLLLDLRYLEAAMDAGANVGAITHQKDLPGINPMGFWDLDIDGPDHGQDLSPFTFRVRRQGETIRAHYWARQPDPTVPLEASYKGKDFDLCTWNTVMPGSVHSSGTVYELEYLEGGEWVSWDGEAFTLDMLPVVDPEQYRAQENLRVTNRPAKVQPLQTKPGNPKKAKKVVVWVAATGSEATRTKMARNDLRYYAWKSISGKNGHDTLMVAMTNLSLFHRLERTLALKMLQEYFNPRCVDQLGNPCPFDALQNRHRPALQNQATAPRSGVRAFGHPKRACPAPSETAQGCSLRSAAPGPNRLCSRSPLRSPTTGTAPVPGPQREAGAPWLPSGSPPPRGALTRHLRWCPQGRH